jgi:N-ethylmaleimide reductase
MLFDPYVLGKLSLRNRLVMAPMTRNRASTDNVPTPSMASYYGQRADVGLIISEGTSPSADGLGYARIPGLFTAEHVAAWKPVTHAVHQKGGRIFVQLMHTGRVSTAANLPAGARTIGPMAEAMPESIYTDANGMVPADVPHALSEQEIAEVVAQYAHSAKLAIEAGFDGVELHGANGYLIEQFLNANVNRRSDGYGGSAQARNRFALEVARATVLAIGADRVGMRISPYGAFNATGAFDGLEAQYLELARELGELKLVYLHLVNHASMGAPEIPGSFIARLRSAFPGAFIASGGMDRARAEALVGYGATDLVAFGRPVLANPDFAARLANDLPLNPPDFSTFYTPGDAGYLDYPALATT